MPTLNEIQKDFCQALRSRQTTADISKQGDAQFSDRSQLIGGARFENLAVYQHLVFSNIDGLLTGNFPIIHQLLGDKRWHNLVENFIQSHQSATPYFSQIAQEFVTFLSQHPLEELPRFLAELADYEYAETRVFIAQENESDNNTPHAICENSFITLKSSVLLKKYDYTVQLISDESIDISSITKPTFILLSRDNDNKVRFLECNTLTFSLLELLRINDASSLSEVVEVLFDSIRMHLPSLTKGELENHAITLSNHLNAMGAIKNIFPKVVI